MFNGADGSSICSACIEHGYQLLVDHELIAGEKKSAKGGSKFRPLRKEDLMRPERIKSFLD